MERFEDDKLPQSAIGAADTRVVAASSIPVQHDGNIVGSLNLYSHQPNGFDTTAEDTAMVFAAEAATAIVNSTLCERATGVPGRGRVSAR